MARKQAVFWGACVANAWEGSWGKANTIGAVLGGAVLAVILHAGGLKMDAPSSVVGNLAFGAGVAAASVIMAWLMIFFGRFAIAPGRVYAAALAKIVALESHSKPAIKIYVEGDGAQAFQLVGSSNKPPGVHAKHVQFTVAPLTGAALVRCEAHLMSVRRIVNGAEGAELAEEVVWLHWSNHPSAVIDIPAPLWKRVNLFHVYETAPNVLKVGMHPPKVLLSTEIQTHGDYRIRVSLTANGVASQEASFLFHWGGYSDVNLVQES